MAKYKSTTDPSNQDGDDHLDPEFNEQRPLLATNTAVEQSETIDHPNSEINTPSVHRAYAGHQEPGFIDKLEVPFMLIFAMITSFIIGYMSWSIWAFLAALLIFVLVFRRRLRRFSKLVISKIQREQARERLATHHETAEWLNLIVGRFWGVYEPVLASDIITEVNQVLAEQCPAFLTSIKLTRFTLGSEPPIVLGIRAYPETDVDVVHFDVDLCFIPRQISDDVLVPTRLKNQFQWNSKIVLAAAFVGIDVPILLENIYLEASARIQLKLISSDPIVKTAEISLLRTPKIDFVLKPMRSLDIMDLPGLNKWLRSMINNILGKELVNPNMLTIHVDELIKKAKGRTENSSGVIRMIVYSAKITKTNEYTGIADPYIALEVNSRPFGKTKKLNDTQTPVWNEVFYTLIQDLNETVQLKVFHYNQLKKDKLLGTSNFPLRELQDVSDIPRRWQGFHDVETNRIKGDIEYGIGYFPCLKPDQITKDLDQYTAGLLRCTVHQAKNVIQKGSTTHKSMNLFAEIALVSNIAVTQNPFNSSQHHFSTKVKKRTNSPIWEETFEIFVKHANVECLWIIFKEDREGLLRDTIIGDIVIPVKEILKEQQSNTSRDWFNMRNAESGRARLTLAYEPIDIPIVEKIERGYSASIGLIHLSIFEARNVSFVDEKKPKAAKHVTGKLYSKVTMSGDTILTTKAIEDSSPVWLDSVYTLAKQQQEHFVIEVCESSTFKHDRDIGVVEFFLEEVTSNMDQYKDRWQSIMNVGNSIDVGSMRYGITWHPVLSAPTPNSNCGILVCQIHEGRNLRVTDSASGQSNYYCEVSLEPTKSERKHHRVADVVEQLYETNIIKGTDSPAWNQVFEMIVFDDSIWSLFIRLFRKEGSKNAELLSTLELPVNVLSENVWMPLPDDKGIFYHKNSKSDSEPAGPALKCSFKYKPVDLKLSKRDVEGEPGTVYLTIVKGIDLMAVDTSGTSDPYCAVKVNGERLFKTHMIRENLNPEWHESFKIHVDDRKFSIITFEIMDWNRIESAESIGSASIDVSSIPVVNSSKSRENKELILPLQNATSGKLIILVRFVPGIDESQKNKQEREEERTGNLFKTFAHIALPDAVKNLRRDRDTDRKQLKNTVDDSAEPVRRYEDSSSWIIKEIRQLNLKSGHGDYYLRVRGRIQDKVINSLYKTKSVKLESEESEGLTFKASFGTEEHFYLPTLRENDFFVFDLRQHYTLKADDNIVRYCLLKKDLLSTFTSGSLWLAPSASMNLGNEAISDLLNDTSDEAIAKIDEIKSVIYYSNTPNIQETRGTSGPLLHLYVSMK